MTDTPPVEDMVFKVPATSLASRRLSEHLGDVLNVKSFGALGNGSHNDRDNIQACFDTAFGGSMNERPGGSLVPHAVANRHLNKAVFIPNGHYIVDTPLVLKDIYGTLIYGCGEATSSIYSSTGNTVIRIDGAKGCCFRDMLLAPVGGSGVNPGLDLDLVTSGSPVGLERNLFVNMGIGAGVGLPLSGVRIGHSTSTQGAGNHFIRIDTSIRIEGAGCVNTLCQGGSGTFTVLGGSLHTNSVAGGGGEVGFVFNSPTAPCTIFGIRSESTLAFLQLTNARVYCANSFGTEPITHIAELTNSTLVMDNSVFTTVTQPGITGNAASKVYLRGCGFHPNVVLGFAGTVVENH